MGLEAAEAVGDHEGSKEGSRYFQIHGSPSEPGKGSMCVHERLE